MKIDSNNILSLKIKNILFFIGLNEKYKAFEYLTQILRNFIDNNKTSKKDLKQEIINVADIHNVSPISVNQEIGKLLKHCTNFEIITKYQFNLNCNTTINRLIVVKNYVKQKLGA